MKTEKKNRKSLQAITIAAFLFSIVSSVTTATGLSQYVFQDNQIWQAGLISFSIQTILFLLNIKLPSLLGHSSNFKKGLFIVPILALYFAMLISSSFFSYVYLFNSSYLSRDISYNDANIVLSNKYNEALNATKNYLNEYIVASELIISKKVADVNNDLPPSDNSGKTLSELEEEFQTAKAQYERAQTAVSSKNEELTAAEEFVASFQVNKFGMTPEYVNAINTIARIKSDQPGELPDLKKEEQEAKLKFEKAEKAYNEYTPSKDELMNETLLKILQNNIQTDDERTETQYLDEALDTLMEMLDYFSDDKNAQANFGELAIDVQSLNITIQQYKIITEKARSSIISDSSLSYVDVYIPDSNDPSKILDWKKDWYEDFNELEQLISGVPTYYEYDDEEIILNTNINSEVLNSYKPTEILDDISEIKRVYLSDINQVERSWDNLFGKMIKYKFSAIFSAIIAILLDLSSIAVGLFVYAYEKDN